MLTFNDSARKVFSHLSVFRKTQKGVEWKKSNRKKVNLSSFPNGFPTNGISHRRRLLPSSSPQKESFVSGDTQTEKQKRIGRRRGGESNKSW